MPSPLSTQSPWPAIQAQIASCIKSNFSLEKITSTGGGCINATYHIEGNGQHYFVKLNKAHYLPMFEAEAAGLIEIKNAGTLHAPEPQCWGQADGSAWLVMEYLDLTGHGKSCGEALGLGLANMHRTFSSHYGWTRDNTIGTTLQKNDVSSDWIDFWRQQRLGYQLQLASANGHTGKLQKRGEQLLLRLDGFFTNTPIRASLLHGDLWGGNYAFDSSGQPVIFDPAVYYGDREADLAMTELFGGFPSSFYVSYQNAYPLDTGYRTRKTLYNLYHILNHLNLFGGGYLHQVEQMLDRLLAEIK